jgi:hypothetical protein
MTGRTPAHGRYPPANPAYRITVPASRLILLPSRESSVPSAGLIRSRRLSRHSSLMSMRRPLMTTAMTISRRTALPVLFPIRRQVSVFASFFRPGLQEYSAMPLTWSGFTASGISTRTCWTSHDSVKDAFLQGHDGFCLRLRQGKAPAP